MFNSIFINLKDFNQFINLFKFSPKKVKNKHNVIVKKIFKSANKNFLSIKSWIVSNEKVEYVVNDPKIPIIIKYLIKSWDKFLLPISIIMYPIKKEPVIFINKVLINK